MTVRATVRRRLALSHGPRRAAQPAHLQTTFAVALLTAIALVPSAALAASQPGDAGAASDEPPSVQYEEAVAHAGDRIAFTPGDRVTVAFAPRATDRWAIDGTRPVQLPAGRASGRAIRESAPGQAEGKLRARRPDGLGAGPAVGAVDVPYVDPASNVFADLAAAVDPGGLKREVFGWLPYWEMSDRSTRLDLEKLSTVAYFGVGAAGNGDLQRRNSDGSTTVGWSGPRRDHEADRRRPSARGCRPPLGALVHLAQRRRSLGQHGPVDDERRGPLRSGDAVECGGGDRSHLVVHERSIGRLDVERPGP